VLGRMRAVLPATEHHRLAAAERRTSAELAWVAARSPGRPVEVLAGFRTRFRPVRPLLGPGYDSAMASLLTVFAELEGALFGSGFDPARMRDAAEKAGLVLSTRDRIVFDTEWLSLSLRGRRLDTARQ
jgi:hypothetical protein